MPNAFCRSSYENIERRIVEMKIYMTYYSEDFLSMGTHFIGFDIFNLI